MALRTTVTAIKQILNTALDDPKIIAFAQDANVWVTEELASKNVLSTERLEIIERYLACALIRSRELGLKSLSLGDVSENYQVDPNVTDYLKHAAALDPTGTIANTFLRPAGQSVAALIDVGRGYADD